VSVYRKKSQLRFSTPSRSERLSQSSARHRVVNIRANSLAAVASWIHGLIQDSIRGTTRVSTRGTIPGGDNPAVE